MSQLNGLSVYSCLFVNTFSNKLRRSYAIKAQCYCHIQTSVNWFALYFRSINVFLYDVRISLSRVNLFTAELICLLQNRFLFPVVLIVLLSFSFVSQNRNLTTTKQFYIGKTNTFFNQIFSKNNYRK